VLSAVNCVRHGKDLVRDMSEALDRIHQARGKVRGTVSKFETCGVANDHPLLFALLHDDQWQGKAIQTGSLIIVIEDGQWKCVVNDRHGGAVAFVTAPTFNDLLRRVEEGLSSGSLDWRGARTAYGRARNGR